jgi:hypothetical protein
MRATVAGGVIVVGEPDTTVWALFAVTFVSYTLYEYGPRAADLLSVVEGPHIVATAAPMPKRLCWRHALVAGVNR